MVNEPTVEFYLLEDGRVVFEFGKQEGNEFIFSNPEYLMGIALNFKKAALLMERIHCGVNFSLIAQECGGIKLDEFNNLSDIGWDDPR